MTVSAPDRRKAAEGAPSVHVVDRFILRIYSLAVAATAVWAALWLVGAGPAVAVAQAFSAQRAALYAYLAAMFLVSVRYLAFRLQEPVIHSFVKDTESGEIRIGYQAVEEMARRAARQVRGVERLRTRVSDAPDGLVVSLRVRAEPNVDLTAMSAALQQSVAEVVRSGTALKVSAVHVQIAGLAPEGAQR